MSSNKLASGDGSRSAPVSARYVENVGSSNSDDYKVASDKDSICDVYEKQANITPQIIEDNELKLKERIAQCKNVIESLKLQLSEEKEKLKTERKVQQPADASKYCASMVEDLGNSSMYSACVDNKLHCDENLIEYEKQLQKYQNTLHMAQHEKKNAIRRQMLAKAFKLKLMEVENQCNIELLRVKQSLQCLEPLQMIASKWKTSTEENLFDVTNYDLMPNFLELKASSGSDVNSYKDDFDIKIATEACNLSKDDSALLE